MPFQRKKPPVFAGGFSLFGLQKLELARAVRPLLRSAAIAAVSTISRTVAAWPAHHVAAMVFAMPHLRIGDTGPGEHTGEQPEAIFLAVIEALIERLLRIGETLQRCACIRHHIRPTAQPFDGII